MFSLWTVMYMLFIGLLAGFVARLLVPGRNPMPWWQTLILGILGSYLGGFGGYILFGWDKSSGAIQLGGIFTSIVGAVVLLLIWRAFQNRRAAHVSAPPTSRPTGTT
jgi:uncharacterized membrane protein YeaQ/YmgE (transglycosylase-associated protein family)